MRSYPKKDANHTPIQNALEKCGFSVADTSSNGNGFPDLVVSKNNITVLVEIKTKSGKLNEKQVRFRKSWQGEYIVVKTIEEAIEECTRICFRDY